MCVDINPPSWLYQREKRRWKSTQTPCYWSCPRQRRKTGPRMASHLPSNTYFERWRNVLLHRVLVGKLTSLQESLTASEKKGNIVNTCTVCMKVGSVYANAYTYAMYSYNSCMYGRLYLYVEPNFLFLNVWCILASLWIRVTELRAVRVPAANSGVAQEQQDRAWSQGRGVQVCLDVLVIRSYRIALQLLFTSTSTLSYLLSLLPFSATIAQSNFAGKQVAKPSSSITST